MHHWRQCSIRIAVSESSSGTSLAHGNHDEPFEPNLGTDLTELDCLALGCRKASPRQNYTNADLQHLKVDSHVCTALGPSNNLNVLPVELVHQTHYEDPADDTDDDLSKVLEDYSMSDNTKKLNFQLKE